MQRYIPKNFEPAEMKKVKLQETMSGLKHDFSIENESNLLKASLEVADDESEIDPIDERKKLEMNGLQSFWVDLNALVCVLDLILFRSP